MMHSVAEISLESSTEADYIADMGFTMFHWVPIFSTATYDGSQVLDYEKLEPHFGYG